MRSIPAILFIALCITSCSFNKAFYRAEKIPANARKAKVVQSFRDSTWVTVINIGENFQPTFTDDKNNLLPLNYTIESVVFTNRSGKKLNGWFLKPKNKPKPEITLLFLHGNGGNITRHNFATAPLTEQGFQVFIFDYSGYGFSEGEPTRMGVLNDASDALAYLRTREDVKQTKVVIYGQSLGGHLAAAVAQRNEALVDGVVMEGAFSSHKDVAAGRYKLIGFTARILVKEGYSAVRSVRKFHKPVLVIHSTEDAVIPISMGRKIYKNANEPKTFYEIKHPHIYGPLYYADSIAAKITQMVQ